MKEVFEELRCTKEGLSSHEGDARLRIFGKNILQEKPESKIRKLLQYIWTPLQLVMEMVAIMATAIMANGDAASMARLPPRTKVLRDGKWSEQDAAILVPGDIVSVKLGDIVPADARLLEGNPLKIDQSALTGVSLLATKIPGEVIYSGSICKQGELEAVVIATGVHTLFAQYGQLVDNTNEPGHFQKIVTFIGDMCICLVCLGIVVECIVMFTIQGRRDRGVLSNVGVLIIGGMPILMPIVLSLTIANGSHRLSKQGAITKRMTAIAEMAAMDVLCSNKTGTLTLNKLTVKKSLVEVFTEGVDKDSVVLSAARAARVENQDAIDAAIVGMLSDPKEARANITEVHFSQFTPTDKRTTITYVDGAGKWHRSTKGTPEQILKLVSNKTEIASRVHSIIDKFAKRGLQSLAVARQEVPMKNKQSPGGPWEFLGLIPLFDLPRNDSAETIRLALNLGINVKMMTGDHLAISKETARRLGMGTDMHPSSTLLGNHRDDPISALLVDGLIEKANGFAGLFPEHKYEIVNILQQKTHVCGVTGDGVDDAPALRKADIGIALVDATDAARNASDIVLTKPGLGVIIQAVLTSRATFQGMKNCAIYAVSITTRIVLGFLLLALIWNFDFSPFMVLIIAILSHGTTLAIVKDRVKPSPFPDSWKLIEVLATGVVLGTYLALMTVLFYWIAAKTNLFEELFHVRSLRDDPCELMAGIFLQVSIINQALIFVTRSRSWSFVERPKVLLMFTIINAQLIATWIAVTANWGFANMKGIGWGWAGVIWGYSAISYLALDVIKFGIRYVFSG